MNQIKNKIIIIGGGASAFFLAANLNPKIGENCVILEQSDSVLNKVKVSGGSRCNVTHACFNYNDLVNFYPRGNKELKSVFSRFNTNHTIEWFEKNGVKLKIEKDGRMFPITDSSQTIIDLLIDKTIKNKVDVITKQNVLNIELNQDNSFKILTQNSEYNSEFLIVSSGSSKKMWNILKDLNHKIIDPVASLFSFNIKDDFLENLSGTSFNNANIKLIQNNYKDSGALLITHWGLSGPLILKTSAWNAIILNKLNYKFNIAINFIGMSQENSIKLLKEFKDYNLKKYIINTNPFELTHKFWQKVCLKSDIKQDQIYTSLSNKQQNKIIELLTNYIFNVQAKSTNKDEFVTAGGVSLNEINFKNMESKKIKNLYFSGEVINVDAVTGGFNFQACWSEAFIISEHLKEII